MKRIIALSGAALMLALGAAPAAAGCKLALVLALDVSSSIDAREFALQRDGLAQAFRDPVVREALAANGPVYATAFQWSGPRRSRHMAGWTRVDPPGAAEKFADLLSRASRLNDNYPTAMGYAMEFATRQFRSLPAPCARRVVDVSGDGVSNHGPGPEIFYRYIDIDGVTVNGLVVRGERPDPLPYYLTTVLHGPGAFVEIAEDFDAYAVAMRRKLLREIGGEMLLGALH